MLPTPISERARAKVNLALHVTGCRADGYHLLDSLVVFCSVADRLTAVPADTFSLTVTGPFAGGIPADAENLVLRAARLVPGTAGAAFTLEKNLPPSSGIGGGSADAAAAIRLMRRIFPSSREPVGTESLGADIPVCLLGQPARMQGIGERLTPVTVPPAGMVLVNPGLAVATPDVFRALDLKDNAAMPDAWPAWPDATAFAGWLRAQRNDLQAPAIRLCPPIATVLDALAASHGVLLARMSGSGATCFGLYADTDGAAQAAEKIAARRPDWWIAAGAVEGGPAGADLPRRA